MAQKTFKQLYQDFKNTEVHQTLPELKALNEHYNFLIDALRQGPDEYRLVAVDAWAIQQRLEDVISARENG